MATIASECDRLRSLLSGRRRIPPPRPDAQQPRGVPLGLHDAREVRLAVQTLAAVLADARNCGNWGERRTKSKPAMQTRHRGEGGGVCKWLKLKERIMTCRVVDGVEAAPDGLEGPGRKRGA